MLKDWKKVYRKLNRMCGVSNEEKIQIALVMKQGGTPMARTMYGLSGGSVVNFIFRITGLRTFRSEYADSDEIMWNRLKIRVLPLERIYKSTKASGREKDIAHLPMIRTVMRSRKLLGAKRPLYQTSHGRNE